jgi:hypothetical protein
MRKRTIAAAGLLIAVALAGGGWAYHQWRFPYGPSHCCISGLALSLAQYAKENGSRYPSGEASPEASLSLLYRSNYADATVLRGMTVPEEQVRRILESGELLGPESCGWHYTEGLTCADDSRIAIVYCKEPLGHNGERTADGGRQVVFVDGLIEWISGEKWPAFLDEQKQLMAQRSDAARKGALLVAAVIELPDGSEIDRVDGPYSLTEELKALWSPQT